MLLYVKNFMDIKNNKNTYNASNFSEVCVSLASSDYILKNSFGEVTQSETINYKTYRPEPNGLFVKEFLDQQKIGNVSVENINISVIVE